MKYKNMSPEKVKTELKEKSEVTLLDVRTKEEYDENHIPNSILIPLNNINDEIVNKIENNEIIIYCRSGRRSKIAAEKLANIGYNNIYVLEGGINNWKYETE